MKNNIPNKLEFCARLDLERYLLKKSGEEIFLEYFPDKSKKSIKTKINESDFQEIWDKIKKLDFQRYKNIAKKDMAPIFSQPGEAISQFIKIIINGKTFVDKELFFPGPEMILNEEFAEPLREINEIILEKFRKNRDIKK
jgi:hypothetical protein